MNEEDSTRPIKNDLAEIPQIYEKFKVVCNPKCRDNTGIFIVIAVYLYSPVSFANSYISRNGVRNGIAEVLGLSKQSVTNYFNNARSLILCHRGFRAEVERVYKLMTGE